MIVGLTFPSLEIRNPEIIDTIKSIVINGSLDMSYIYRTTSKARWGRTLDHNRDSLIRHEKYAAYKH